MNVDALSRSQGWFVEHGYVQKPVGLGQVVDAQSADDAVAQLGLWNA